MATHLLDSSVIIDVINSKRGRGELLNHNQLTLPCPINVGCVTVFGILTDLARRPLLTVAAQLRCISFGSLLPSRDRRERSHRRPNPQNG